MPRSVTGPGDGPAVRARNFHSSQYKVATGVYAPRSHARRVPSVCAAESRSAPGQSHRRTPGTDSRGRRVRHYHTAPSGTPAPAPAARRAPASGRRARHEQAAIAAPSPASRPGTGCRRSVTIASPPRCKESKLHNWTTATATRSASSSSAPGGLGPGHRPDGPGLRHHQVLRRADPRPGLRQMRSPRRPRTYSTAPTAPLHAVGIARRQLAGYFTGQSPHGVTAGSRRRPSGQANLTGGCSGSRPRSGQRAEGGSGQCEADPFGEKGQQRSAVLRVRQASAWTVANWLVAHARLRPERSTVCRVCVESRERQYGLAAASTPTSASGKNARKAVCRWLMRHPSATRHTVVAAGRRQEFTRDLHHRAPCLMCSTRRASKNAG